MLSIAYALVEVVGMQEYAFAGAQGALNRAAHLRRDLPKLAALLAVGAVTPIWRGRVAIDAEDGLVWLDADHPALVHGGIQIFLGFDGDRPLFAVDISAWQPAEEVSQQSGFLDQSLQPHPNLAPASGFIDLRAVMTRLGLLDAECAATAKALLSWHDAHGFCARCGAASVGTDAGWQRHCIACHAPHFPRTDPVVIMLITRGDKLLLGRSPQWPETMYSLLAGFVEPGETIEAAVRREVFEEAGVHVGDVRYLVSQPWPFPASLMLGCIGNATSDEITVDPAELEDAMWLSREQMIDVQLGRTPKVTTSRKGAIAAGLIQYWLSGKLG